MWYSKSAAFLLCAGVVTTFNLYGQTSTSPAAGKDVLIFTDGEKLIGHLESATSASVVFKSDMAGTVTVDWSKIQDFNPQKSLRRFRRTSNCAITKMPTRFHKALSR
jgi:hypothetical protein